MEENMHQLEANRGELRNEVASVTDEHKKFQESLEFTQRDVDNMKKSKASLRDEASITRINELVLKSAEKAKAETLRLKEYTQRNNLILKGYLKADRKKTA